MLFYIVSKTLFTQIYIGWTKASLCISCAGNCEIHSGGRDRISLSWQDTCNPRKTTFHFFYFPNTDTPTPWTLQLQRVRFCVRQTRLKTLMRQYKTRSTRDGSITQSLHFWWVATKSSTSHLFFFNLRNNIRCQVPGTSIFTSRISKSY